MLVLLATLVLIQDEAYIQADSKRIERYRKVLEKMPEDPEASLQVGRHLCFVKSDWDGGLPLLARGKDKALAELAQHELGTLDFPSDKDSPLTGAVFDFGAQAAPDLLRGDALWEIARKQHDPELKNVMNRAIWRYRLAMASVEADRKKKLTDRISKVMEKFRSTYLHPGKVTDGPPKGWGVVVGKGEKIEGVALDETRSRSGRSSMKVTPAKAGLLVTERRPIMPGEYVLSFWYLAEGTIASDLFHVLLFDTSDGCEHVKAPMPPDRGEIPVWTKVEIKVKVSQNVLNFRLYVDNVGMREGSLWIDDLSFRSTGQKSEELAPNGGFEDR
jgi:hypothetical protein